MSIPLSYLGVVVIWATTPLAIKWSGEGPGFLFGVTGRMTISVLVALLVMRLLGLRLRWDRPARHTYLAAGMGIYCAMLAVYWGAQHIPSGWVSVLFGITPIVTGLMAGRWLQEQALTRARLGGMLLGVVGLAVMFATGADLATASGAGIAAVLSATLFHSASAVWIKRIDAHVPALATVAGGLLVAVPLYLITWALFDGRWPALLPVQALAAILYLALFGSVLGFALYYYVLRHVEATRVALITLVTPVSALLLGHFLNGEPLTLEIGVGTGLIVSGLALFEFGGRGSARPAAE